MFHQSFENPVLNVTYLLEHGLPLEVSLQTPVLKVPHMSARSPFSRLHCGYHASEPADPIRDVHLQLPTAPGNSFISRYNTFASNMTQPTN